MIESTPLTIPLGYGFFSSKNWEGSVYDPKTDSNEDIIGLEYFLLKEPVKPNTNVEESNIGPEVLKLMMTPDYAKRLIKTLQTLVDTYDKKVETEQLKKDCVHEYKDDKCEVTYVTIPETEGK